MTEYLVEFVCGPVYVTVNVQGASSAEEAVELAESDLEFWGVKLPREYDLSVTED